MKKYTLSLGGRSRFRAVKREILADIGRTKMEGYEVLDYLYENGSGTVEEITNQNDLPQSQVMNRLMAFINQGFVEKLTEA